MRQYLQESILLEVCRYITWGNLIPMNYLPDIVWKQVYDYFCRDPQFRLWIGDKTTTYRELFLNFIETKITAFYPIMDEIPNILRSDRDFVSKIVQYDGLALLYMDSVYLNDRDIVLTAVKQNLSIYDNIKNFRDDYRIVKEAVKQDGRRLRLVDLELKRNKKIVLCAVRQDGNSLFYADPILKADRDIVLTAVKQDGYAITYADRSLLYDAEIRNEAIEHLSSDLKDLVQKCSDPRYRDKFRGGSIYGFIKAMFP